MPLPRFKPKILLDENMPPRVKLPRTNHRFDVKHITLDLHKSGIKDEEVYQSACAEKRLIVTSNYKDFIQFSNTSSHTGVIGISTNLSAEQIDKKLSSKLIRSKRNNLYGDLTFISGETK